MEKSVRVQNILSQIMKLDNETRLYLLERLISQLRKTNKESNSISHNLSELNSLGSDVWKDVDIDKYIEEERNWD